MSIYNCFGDIDFRNHSVPTCKVGKTTKSRLSASEADTPLDGLTSSDLGKEPIPITGETIPELTEMEIAQVEELERVIMPVDKTGANPLVDPILLSFKSLAFDLNGTGTSDSEVSVEFDGFYLKLYRQPDGRYKTTPVIVTKSIKSFSSLSPPIVKTTEEINNDDNIIINKRVEEISKLRPDKKGGFNPLPIPNNLSTEGKERLLISYQEIGISLRVKGKFLLTLENALRSSLKAQKASLKREEAIEISLKAEVAKRLDTLSESPDLSGKALPVKPGKPSVSSVIRAQPKNGASKSDARIL